MKTLITLFEKNQPFFLPFLLWLVAGGILQAFFFTHEELFFAINQAHAPWADVLMTGITYIGDGITFGVMLVVLLVMRRFRLFWTAATLLIVVAILVQTGKHYFNAPRPMQYFEDPGVIHLVKWVAVHGSCSFPSGHTTTAFAMFCYLTLISRWKISGLYFLALALITAYSRIYLAQHFFIDVYVGSIVGTSSAVLVYSLFELRKINTSPEICAEAKTMVGIS